MSSLFEDVLETNTLIAMPLKEEIGKLIKYLRNVKGISQEMLATDLGISRRYLSDLEGGKRNLSIEMTTKISSFFQLNLSTFLTLAEESWKFIYTYENLSKQLVEMGYEGTSIFESPDYLEAIVYLIQCLLIIPNTT